MWNGNLSRRVGVRSQLIHPFSFDPYRQGKDSGSSSTPGEVSLNSTSSRPLVLDSGLLVVLNLQSPSSRPSFPNLRRL